MFQFILMAACIHGAMLGLTALSKEESEGTIEFLYAKPVSRTQIVSGKLSAAAVSYLCYFAVISIVGVIAGMIVRPEDLELMDMAVSFKSVLLGGMIAGFTYLLLGFAVSVLLRKAKHAASMAVMLFFLTYIVGSIPTITGVLDFLKWVSPLNYFTPGEVVVNGIDGINVLISVLIMGASAALTYSLYRKRNFYI
jgi:ABC-2 type transport system permease protein